MKLLDRAISAISPGWAVKRQMHRRTLDRLAADVGYDAGRGNRIVQDWPTSSRSVDSMLSGDRRRLLARARDAVANTSQGAAIRKAFERNVVRTGITPQFAVRRRSGDLDATFNRQAQELWDDWAGDPRQVDVERKLSFYRLQRRAIGELIEAGEHFIVLRYDRRREGVPLQLQCFEPEQLDEGVVRDVRSGNEVRHGIEVDREGRAVAYHFRRLHDSDLFQPGPETIRVPASMVLHLFDPHRVKMSHGISRLTPVLNRMAALAQYENAILTQTNLQACIGLIKKPMDGVAPGLPGVDGPPGAPDEDDYGNTLTGLEPGMIVEGNYEPFNPSSPNSVYDEFVMHQDRAIAAGAGSSYEQVARDFSQGTYSSQRQGMLEEWAEYEVLVQLMVEQVCQPVLEAFVRTAVMEGMLSARNWSTSPRRYFRANWQGPSRPWIDPMKEAQAAQTFLELGIDTPQRILNTRGTNVDDTYAQIADARRAARRYGLDDLAGPPGGGAEPATPAPDAEEVEE